MTNEFECVLSLDDIDLSRPDLWRPRMIDLVDDETFRSLMTDLATTAPVIGEQPVSREWGGSCTVGASVGSGGGVSGSISCGIRF